MIDLNKAIEKTFKFLRNPDMPKHWSKTKNEKYDAHLMVVLYILFCMADKTYKCFRQLVKLCPLSLKLKSFPNPSILWCAWRCTPPRFYYKLIQLSDKGGRDECVALDLTYLQITRPSVVYMGF